MIVTYIFFEENYIKSLEKLPRVCKHARSSGTLPANMILKEEGIRDNVKNIHGYKVMDLEMIPKLENALGGELKSSFIT